METETTPRFSEHFLAEAGQHQNKKVIWIVKSDYEDRLFLRKKSKILWSRSQKNWYLLDHDKNRELLNMPQNPLGKAAMANIHPNNLKHFFDFHQTLLLKGYSKNTIRTYLNEFAQFLYALKSHSAAEINEDKIRSYIVYCLEKLGHSENQIHSRINAMKFFYEKVLNNEKMFLGIPRPKKPALLPKHLSAAEIQKIIDVTPNPKHALIIKACYGMGLRVSEIAALKLEHINTNDMKVLISAAKGKKDRYVFLPETLLAEMKRYYKNYRPELFLFEGSAGSPLSVRTLQLVFKNAMKKAEIHRNVGIHCLRHSYATHLLEYGTDISHIQKLLGHNNIKTTLNYTRVTDKNLSRIISPLDRLQSVNPQ